MITQLNPALPLITPKGKGWAHFVLDYSQEHDLLWVVFLNKNGQCWTFPNSEVSMDNNISLGRYDFSSGTRSFYPREHYRQSDRFFDPWHDGQESWAATASSTWRVA